MHKRMCRANASGDVCCGAAERRLRRWADWQLRASGLVAERWGQGGEGYPRTGEGAPVWIFVARKMTRCLVPSDGFDLRDGAARQLAARIYGKYLHNVGHEA
ncbi:hypothetical protein JCM9534A_67000 [Catenuloplanes indicus JCM 9534]